MNVSSDQVGPDLPREVIRILKDGYWDITEIVKASDGYLRVRKRNKGSTAPGPWGVESLRREIRYLTSLSSRARVVFPEVLASWDKATADSVEIGYEIPFFPSHTDAGELARRGALGQAEANAFQDSLAEAVLQCLHEPTTSESALSQHMVAAMRHAMHDLSSKPVFAGVIEAELIELNGRPALGTRHALDRLVAQSDAFAKLDAVPSVRLHGDFFLENILWSSITEPDTPRLILIDPVSVAGISTGLPLFDLVKYESYATGELLALRTERVVVSGFDNDDRRYHWRVRVDDPSLTAFQSVDWHSRFRRAFEAKHGPVNRRLVHLIDGYFSIAMALNTTGLQQQARLLKGTAELNAALG